MNDRAYVKLFSSIVTSSMWSEDPPTRVVWVTMLTLKDKFQEVHASLPGLARAANVPLADAEAAIKKFLSPDPYSRTKEHEGRRIEEIPGGWRILNGEYYRRLMSIEERREYKRIKEAERRARLRAQNVDKSGQSVTKSGQILAETETEAYTEAEPLKTTTNPGWRKRPKDLQMVLDRAAITGCPPAEAERFWHHYESSGWIDKNGNPVVNWQSKLAIWATDARARPLEQAHKGQSPQLSNVDKSIFSKEFDRVEARIKSIKDSYAEHQTCSKQDAERLSALRARRDELKKLLGMQV